MNTYMARRMINEGQSDQTIAVALDAQPRTIRTIRRRMADPALVEKEQREVAKVLNAYWLYSMDLISAARISQFFDSGRDYLTLLLWGESRQDLFEISQRIMRDQCRAGIYDQAQYMADCFEQIGLPVEQEEAA